jgi:redox-sensitive bicupin YhaK (pirin superfamily)
MSFDLVEGKPRDLGGFTVRRVLPSLPHRSVGPFVFFDQLGPALLPAGDGVQVRPHPHIGLATVTFMFDGELMHRDSLGSVQAIRPGDVNWMTSGRGIVHSERSPVSIRDAAQPIHAIQSWVAVPKAHEDGDPSFAHHSGATLPGIERPGVRITVIAGDAFGVTAPVAVLVPTLYAVATMEPGSTLVLDDRHDERAVFVVEGDVAVDDMPVPAQTMAVLTSAGDAVVSARGKSIVMLVGGARLDAPRALEWNFVASDRAAIDAARADWAAFPNARFPQVPGETEYIPLPPRPRPEPTTL